jgi:hypothetical protein
VGKRPSYRPVAGRKGKRNPRAAMNCIYEYIQLTMHAERDPKCLETLVTSEKENRNSFRFFG